MFCASRGSSVRRLSLVAAIFAIGAVCVVDNAARADPPPRPPARLSDFNPGQIDRVHRVIYLKPGEVPPGPAPVLWTYRRLLMSPGTIEISTLG